MSINPIRNLKFRFNRSNDYEETADTPDFEEFDQTSTVNNNENPIINFQKVVDKLSEPTGEHDGKIDSKQNDSVEDIMEQINKSIQSDTPTVEVDDKTVISTYNTEEPDSGESSAEEADGTDRLFTAESSGSSSDSSSKSTDTDQPTRRNEVPGRSYHHIIIAVFTLFILSFAAIQFILYLNKKKSRQKNRLGH